MSWAHREASYPDPAWDAFVVENASSGSQLLFGRRTYELMASYWPTAMAAQQNEIVANRMNGTSKIVFSKTLKTADWKNTVLVKNDLVQTVKNIKADPEFDTVILGSGSIVSQLTEAALIDEYQIATVPVIMGGGKCLFDGNSTTSSLKLVETRGFANGNIFSRYVPSATEK